MANKKRRNKFNSQQSRPNRKSDSTKKSLSKDKVEKKVSPFFGHVLLLAVSIILIIVIRGLPENKEWEENRFNRFLEEKETYGDNMDSTYRYNLVNGRVAGILTFLSDKMEENAVFLLPPQEYLVEKAFKPEKPREFFFWTNPSYFKNHSLGKIDFVLASDPDSVLQKADYTFWVMRGSMRLLKLDKQAMKDSVIKTFKTKRQHAFFSVNDVKKHLQTLSTK